MWINIINFPSLGDERGSLVSLEGNSSIPFEIKRVYYIFDTKLGVKRGFHAHVNLEQMAIVVKGSCTFILDDGNEREEISLNNPNQGLHIKGLIWREMHDITRDCVILVMASEHYDEVDYIRDYEVFMKKINEK